MVTQWKINKSRLYIEYEALKYNLISYVIYQGDVINRKRVVRRN